MNDATTARAAISREVQAITAALPARGAGTWSARCVGEWSVADLARHLVWGQTLQAGAWRRLRAGELEAWAPPPVDEPDPSRLPDLLARAHDDFDAVLGAVEPGDLARPCPLPYGAPPGAFVLDIAVMEVGIHHYDVARALGDNSGLADDVVGAGMRVFAATLPMLAAAATETPPQDLSICLAGQDHHIGLRYRDGQWQPEEVTDPAVALRGTDEQLLLFAAGRRPFDDGLVVEGDRRMAAQFKRFFPGP